MAPPDLGRVDPQEAIDFFRQKLNLPTETWTDLWQGMHARAFVVAGAKDAALIEDFRQAVDKAIAQGTTLDEFRKDFDRIVQTHGWSYNGSRGWRSRVIFETNLRTAYASGKWQQIQRLKERRPWLRYVAVQDARTRPEHAAWHNTVLPVDDPFWRTHFPPNGWRCRCTVQQLSERDLRRYGLSPSESPPPVRTETRRVATPGGEVPLEVPEGIDTGFAYNVGEAAWGRAQQRMVMESHGPWEPLDAPGGPRPVDPEPLPERATDIPRGPSIDRGDEDALRQALTNAIGGPARTLTDPAGGYLRVTQALADHIIEKPEARWDGRERFWPLIPDLVEAPEEIWVGFARDKTTGKVALRRRYAKLLRIDRQRTLGVVADAEDGLWQAMTFFRGNVRSLNNLRKGIRVYRRGEE